ncbi:MAG: DUF695 domain-containing protein [Flavobacterium sp.]|uniref:DUF695 domain-containing protein n=1 Tax=Flavobacterium sp. TaxID=239 RepID=UPI001203EDEB|nr:DUF695 domain-containing protein [Flavobacterium sp.]RZJ67023.1 MAG: DUF695 domain-containing protein [Flavobacterium sp.]
MNFLQHLFGKQHLPDDEIAQFWKWFAANEKRFYKAIAGGENLHATFFDELSSRLEALRPDIYLLTGMRDAKIAELIFTPDGIIKNIAFTEDLVAASPSLKNWKFTALKPKTDITELQIDMGEYVFNDSNIWFYPNTSAQYPDEIDITIVFEKYTEDEKPQITNGIYLFLDNYLGELNSVTSIDNLWIKAEPSENEDLIPISKLQDYLIWREKEFVEKYEGTRRDTEDDEYTSLEATLENDLPLIAIVNSSLLDWEAKGSHPWILKIEIAYDGTDLNGMPDDATYALMDKFELEIMDELKDADGYLNVARETADSLRCIYFACKDFRKPSEILYALILSYRDLLNVSYDMYKDKYWQSLERFRAD